MRKTINLLFFIWLSGILLLVPGQVMAGIEPNHGTLTGPFSTGANYTTQDAKFSDPNWGTFVTKSIVSTVSLRVLDNVLISSAFTYTPTLQIQYYTAPGAAATTINISLTVNYVPGQGAVYKGLDSYKLPASAYKIIVTVTGASATGTVPASSVQLNTDIVIDRTYPFVSSTGIGAVYTYADNNKQLQVNWTPMPSANEYDVEWTTINNGNSNYTVISANASSPSTPDNPTLSAALAQAFRNNASRITTAQNNVGISLISTDNILLVRIRKAQYDLATGIRVTGNWDYKNASGYAIWPLTWNEQNQNWQYSAAFAEDGKKKEVISYFDGTLRGRQTVTLNNSDNVAVAQENVYDDFGRATASILPAPYKEPTVVPYLHYISNFNRNASNTPYTFSNVSGTIAALCEFNPDPLNTTSGASRYYSNQNDFKSLSLNNNYIPDAEGFPLSVTQYTDDNTGRIKSQGGVGLAFQPGKSGAPLLSKTTKYYYGKPEQWELDKLFANDAGYAEHYLKNMVIDPNGQISISYLNASGKTIATALTGKAPAMLDSLPSYKPVLSTNKPENIHILKPEQFIYDNSALTLTANTTYLASVTGMDTLKFNIQKLINHYPGTFNICSNCYYKMTVKVSDDCGNTAAEISTPVEIGSKTGDCADTETYNGVLNVPINQIGEYNVNIQFAFDNTVIQTYTDAFISKGIENNYIEKQFDYIKARYLDNMDVASCYSDCHSCSALLGGQTDFVQMLKDKCIALGLDPGGVNGSSFSTWANGLYTTLKANCTAMQATCSYEPCAAVESVMKTDVSPGGQYALFDAAGNTLEPDINVITEILPGHTDANWRIVFPVLPSSDPIYQSNLITLPNNVVTSPNDAGFTVLELITYWKPEWAVSFLGYHPEKCKLDFCIANAAYESWDMLVQQDFNTAASVAQIPTGGTPLSYSHTNAADWLLEGDPFFHTGPGSPYLSAMKHDLENYSIEILGVDTAGHDLKGLMKYVDYLLYCQDATGNTNTTITTTNWDSCTPNDDCRVADREWTTYRQYYFDLKQKYYTLLRNESCGSNCPIGQPIVSSLPGGCPEIREFSVQHYEGASTCGSGNQTVVVTYNSGVLGRTVKLGIYYQPFYDNIGLTHFINMDPGESQKTFCVPDNIPVSAIHINSVDCGGGPTYGNDPTYVIHIEDTDGGTVTDVCGNVYTSGVHTTTVSLRDQFGNPVTGEHKAVDVYINYTVQYCGSSAFDVQRDFLISNFENTTTYVYPTLVDCLTDCEFPNFNNIHCVDRLVNASNVEGVGLCDDYTFSNPQPPFYWCPTAYPSKTPRFPDLGSTYNEDAKHITSSAELTDPIVAAIKSQAADLCAGAASAWISRLQPGFDAMPTPPTSTEISNLTAALIAICSAGGDQTHPMGTSTLPPGTLPYDSFGAAIKDIILHGGSYTPSVNPWLIESPYPYNVTQQAVAKTISNSNSALCDMLAGLTADAATAGQTLYNYLVSTYGDAMTLSPADLDVLQTGCTTCRFILARDISLPVFLDPGAQGCITRSAYNTAKSDLLTIFGGSLSSSDPNYPTILSNYMNLRWGFSLTYDSYVEFEGNAAPQLCNSLPYGTTNADPYDCIKNAVSRAVNNGLADYDAYIANQRQLFITSYISTCKLAQANTNLIAVQQQYHYTLYYYDQADNLVRTVPPEGVALMDPGLFFFIDKARDNDINPVPYTYDGPTSNSNLTTALTTLSATLSAPVGAVEMWLYNNLASHYHWVEVTPDRKYLFQVNVAGSKLNIDVYPMSETTGPVAHLLPVTGHYQADISALLPLLPFTHVVFQGANLGAASSLPQLYLNGTQVTVTTTGTPAPVGFGIKATAGGIVYPDSIQHLKHLRLYTHLLTQTNISNNADNRYFNTTDVAYAGWYRFNVPAVGQPPTTVNANTNDETTLFDIYNTHGLKTTYAYNSTNQLNRQLSPDGGTNRFWYDLKSRLVISQNDKQLPGNNYSYTMYDVLGRITTVRQKNQASVSLGNPDYLADATITSFNGAGTNSQITTTYYDKTPPVVSGVQTTLPQNNLRKRVSASTYTETQGTAVRQATYYNYDIDGNVSTLWQQVDSLGTKRIDYEYDLVSGKVNFVRYQSGLPDRFYYSYNYDADNRLTGAWSGTEAMVDPMIGSSLLSTKRKDGGYKYYLHGPLARMELGDSESKVQGVDYAYTLQGWLKGINSTAVLSQKDMGRDSTNAAKDAYGYALYYYGNGSTIADYVPIGGTNPFETRPAGLSTFNGLYNGNIAAISANTPTLTNPWHYYTYKYDQLNRIKQANVYQAGPTATLISDYKESFTYDGNGNILTTNRHGNTIAGINTMDSLVYRYTKGSNGKITSNKLNYINDYANDIHYTNDLKNQTNTSNYTYDATGNLLTDQKAGITNINWNVYGKITNITKTGGNINYDYNTAQQRTKKRTAGINTYYVCDAQGNTLAVYDNKDGAVNWREQTLYGSSRLGMWQPDLRVNTDSSYTVWDSIGRKQFELTNHLGNVLATISDRRTQHSTDGTTIANYTADVSTAQQYYAFGSLMPGQTYTANANYRYGFNGKENDNEVKGVGNQQDYGNRIYDTRVGRFLSVDPLQYQYPELTPYQFASNSPIQAIDLDGLEAVGVNAYISSQSRERDAALRRGDFKRVKQIKQNIEDQASTSILTAAILLVPETTSWLTRLFITNPQAGITATGLAWGAFTDEDMPGFGDDLSRDTREALRSAERTVDRAVGLQGRFVIKKFDKVVDKAWLRYQGQINGLSGKAAGAWEYLKNGVKFDGFRNGVLLEAKGFYQQLFKSGKADRQEIFGNMMTQLRRQIGAAKGDNLEWHFAEQSTLDGFKAFLNKLPEGRELLENVDLKYTEFKPEKLP